MTDKEMCAVFAKNLTDIMRDKGIKQADIVRELRVAKATVSGWCAGLNIPRTDALSRLIEMLEVEPSDLLTTRKPTPDTESGLSDPVIAQIMDIVTQMSPDERRLYLENLNTLRLLQAQGRKPDIQDLVPPESP